MEHQDRFLNKVRTPSGTHLIHVPFSCKRWMSTKSVRLELSEKILLLSKHGDIILNSMSLTGEKWVSHTLSRPNFWMVWGCHGIPWLHFYFLFRTNGKKEHLDESNFRHCYGIFFKSAILEVTWSQSSLSRVARHIDNSILEDILQLKILRT